MCARVDLTKLLQDLWINGTIQWSNGWTHHYFNQVISHSHAHEKKKCNNPTSATNQAIKGRIVKCWPSIWSICTACIRTKRNYGIWIDIGRRIRIYSVSDHSISLTKLKTIAYHKKKIKHYKNKRLNALKAFSALFLKFFE